MIKKQLDKWKHSTYSQKSTILVMGIILLLTLWICVDWLLTSASFNYRKKYREKNVIYWEKVEKGIIEKNYSYSLKNDGVTKEWRFKSDTLHFRLNKLPSTTVIDYSTILLFLIIVTNAIATGNAAVTTVKNFNLPKEQRGKMPLKQLLRSWYMFICWSLLLITVIYIKKCSTDLDTFTNVKIPIPVEEIMTGFGLLLSAIGITNIVEKASIEAGVKKELINDKKTKDEDTEEL